MKVKKFYILLFVILSLAFSTVSSQTFAAKERPGNPVEGERLFLMFCAACHGPSGKGEGAATRFLEKKPRDFTDQNYMVAKSDQELYDFMTKDKPFHGTKYLPQLELHLEPQQGLDLVAYIRVLYQKPKGNPIEGRKLHLIYCSTCHGKSGKGDGKGSKFLDTKPKDHTENKYMSTLTDEYLYSVISGGGSSAHRSKFMPKWSVTLKPQNIWDLITYTRDLHRKPGVKGDATKGKAIYSKSCWGCHGQNGMGDGPIAKALTPRPQDLTNAPQMQEKTDLELYYAILGGGKAIGASNYMPPWEKVLSEQELWDLVVYIRSLKK